MNFLYFEHLNLIPFHGWIATVYRAFRYCAFSRCGKVLSTIVTLLIINDYAISLFLFGSIIMLFGKEIFAIIEKTQGQISTRDTEDSRVRNKPTETLVTLGLIHVSLEILRFHCKSGRKIGIGVFLVRPGFRRNICELLIYV